ncbi:Metacaspase-1 [Arthrobotrys entomopaga]|nr:Metacaspase-1 [Arthrobotrys entomopaga]
MTTSPRRFALLIGIDFYFQGAERLIDGVPILFSRLKGCVKDVYDVQTTLNELFENDGGCDIRMLTASNGTDKQHRTTPVETDKLKWPTHQNIVHGLEKLDNDVEDGDLVYIHYSGHGIRRTREQDEYEEGIGPGTALVPMDVAVGGAYITGHHLGVLIRKLFQGRENLRVVLVLDSCFSGSGLRSIRDGIDREDGVYLAARTPVIYDETMLTADEVFNKFIENTDVSMDGDRRSAIPRSVSMNDIPGCTIITACAIDETAFEYIFPEQRGPNGVLTFWFLHCLRFYRSRGTATYTKIRDYVVDEIESMGSKIRGQVPVFYGDDCYEFFSHKRILERPSCRVIEGGDILELAIGRAEGVFNGAIYDIYPEDFQFGDAEQKDIISRRIAQVRIEDALDFRSDATLVKSDILGIGIERNCRAVLNTWALSSNMSVSVDIPEAEFPRGKLAQLIQKLPGLYLKLEDRTSNWNFKVSLSGEGYFKIRDNNSRRLANIPTISISEDSAVEKLAYTICHLARFRDIKNLQSRNELSSLASMPFVFELLTTTGDYIPKSSNGGYEVKENQEVIISFTNRNPARPVYVTFFCLTSAWGIEKLCPLDGSRGYKTWESEPVQDPDPLSFGIPPRAGPDDPAEVDDILRACVYYGNDPPSWNGLTLPDLPTQGRAIRIEEALEAVLGVPENGDQARNSKVVKEDGISGVASDGDWAFIDIVVHVSSE